MTSKQLAEAFIKKTEESKEALSESTRLNTALRDARKAYLNADNITDYRGMDEILKASHNLENHTEKARSLMEEKEDLEDELIRRIELLDGGSFVYQQDLNEGKKVAHYFSVIGEKLQYEKK